MYEFEIIWFSPVDPLVYTNYHNLSENNKQVLSVYVIIESYIHKHQMMLIFCAMLLYVILYKLIRSSKAGQVNDFFFF